MPRITIRPFSPASDLGPAAELLAARHRADRARLPALAAAVETPDGAANLIKQQVAEGAKGVVAELDSRFAGYLLGQEMLFPPTVLFAQWFEPHSISINVEAHAVAPGLDRTLIYRAMYADAAADWVSRGFFVHQISVVPGDADTQEAWLSLGFGRKFTAAVRDTSLPIEGLREGPLDVREASSEDIEVIMGLTETLDQHHLSAPMFWPIVRTAHAAARQYNLETGLREGIPYFLAYEGSEPIGMQSFLRPGHTPSIVEPEGTVYLFDGVMEPSARSGGTGTRLLAHTMAWANGAGYERCCLHFASANPSGAPFWLGHSFIPVEHTMLRHVDQRVAWAR